MLDFNTSYVVIKRIWLEKRAGTHENFNTSYVVIKPVGPGERLVVQVFQYILCCY